MLGLSHFGLWHCLYESYFSQYTHMSLMQTSALESLVFAKLETCKVVFLYSLGFNTENLHLDLIIRWSWINLTAEFFFLFFLPFFFAIHLSNAISAIILVVMIPFSAFWLSRNVHELEYLNVLFFFFFRNYVAESKSLTRWMCQIKLITN